MNNKILKAKNITKTYKSGHTDYNVIKDVSIEIDKGEFVGIMGASGAGKSTFMNILSTIDTPTSGTIEVNTKNLTTFSEKELSAFRRNELGFIFQDYNLLDTLTVKENIILPLTLGKKQSVLAVERIESEFKRVTKIFNISELKNKYPLDLSGGQRQRVAAARAIITNPTLLFADEPTGALDSKSAGQLLSLLEKLNTEEKATIIMVTHDAVAASHCKRIIFISDGKIKKELLRGEFTREVFLKEILAEVGRLGEKNV